MLQEDVKAMVERFLEYVMNNHLVNKEQAAILQAFQISLVRDLFSCIHKFILQLWIMVSFICLIECLRQSCMH